MSSSRRRRSLSGREARRPRVERRDGYRVIVGGPVPRQASAITMGHTIMVRRDHANSDPLMAHELVHVRQFAQLGRARFLSRYVRSYLRLRLSGFGHMAAYRRIPLEVEASWLSRLHSRGALEPGAVLDSGEPGSHARAPRMGATVLLQDRAEAMTEAVADAMSLSLSRNR